MTIAVEADLTEEAYAERPGCRAQPRRSRSPRSGGTPVICTQGKVIPDLLRVVVRHATGRGQVTQPQGQHVGAVAVDGDRLVAADHIASPLATRP